MTETPQPPTFGPFIDLGGLWVRYDAIGTIKQIDGADGTPYCQVVLTLPGYKTLGVGCPADDLIKAVIRVQGTTESIIGYERATGMRNAGAR